MHCIVMFAQVSASGYLDIKFTICEPGMRKLGLMCTQNLTTFLNFTSITLLIKIVQITFPPFMQHFMGNMQTIILNSKGDIYHNTKRCILCT